MTNNSPLWTTFSRWAGTLKIRSDSLPTTTKPPSPNTRVLQISNNKSRQDNNPLAAHLQTLSFGFPPYETLDVYMCHNYLWISYCFIIPWYNTCCHIHQEKIKQSRPCKLICRSTCQKHVESMLQMWRLVHLDALPILSTNHHRLEHQSSQVDAGPRQVCKLLLRCHRKLL